MAPVHDNPASKSSGSPADPTTPPAGEPCNAWARELVEIINVPADYPMPNGEVRRKCRYRIHAEST